MCQSNLLVGNSDLIRFGLIIYKGKAITIIFTISAFLNLLCWMFSFKKSQIASFHSQTSTVQSEEGSPRGKGREVSEQLPQVFWALHAGFALVLPHPEISKAEMSRDG